MLNAVTQGFLVGLSLIVAIGAQNAFVLKQGLKKQHIFWICLVCALSDSLLILSGVLGFAQIMIQYPAVVQISKFAGALFLIVYGAQHFYHSFKHSAVMQESSIQKQNLSELLLICLALTWLNPHVYLDTVVLIGTVSTQFAGQEMAFAAGAITASWLFFFSLGYAARWLQPVFTHSEAWKILDFLIGVVMWSIAVSLLI
ncbi:LysE/ArgO family amino acid transporter [Acinetobacter chinensis]|uniref:LysE/ArgO family amino acid transporter n=2 Tax=Acinetobacter chinensis TaxID=2004650 RepID=A0ABU3WCL3_9GAMM|nr:LysE/ArgO family amino acid transporter [Acinetobacter chinensis]MDV2467966.1 LysE/ArgO family amino acid transporter [Acinetobacter chinensis]